MDKIPTELVTKVFDNMSIKDSFNYVSSHKIPDNVMGVHRDRVSIHKYLSDGFGADIELLKAMEECDVYISGSRALEYFVRGSVDKNSDWDFYIPALSNLSPKFMKYLQTLGVKWDNVYEEMELLFAGGQPRKNVKTLLLCNYMMYAIRNKLPHIMSKVVVYRQHMFYANSEDAMPRVYQAIADNIYGTHVAVHVREERVTLSKADDDFDVDTYSNIRSVSNVVHGTLIRNNKIVGIQLVQDNRNESRGVDAVLQFHSTCVQAFINSTHSVHLYHNMSTNRKAFFWTTNCMKDNRNEDYITEVQQKYIKRGYKYLQHPPRFDMKLSASSPDTLIVRHPRNKFISDDIVIEREVEANDIAWYEYDDATVSAAGPVSARNNSSYRTIPHSGVCVEDAEYCAIYGVVISYVTIRYAYRS